MHSREEGVGIVRDSTVTRGMEDDGEALQEVNTPTGSGTQAEWITDCDVHIN